MSNMTGLADLVAEIKSASRSIEAGEVRTNKQLESMAANIDELYRKVGRPGAEWTASDDEVAERKDAIEMCRARHSTKVAKHEDTEYTPPSSEVEEAICAQRGLTQYLRHGNMDRLQPEFRKSLSSFSFGPPGSFMLPMTQADRVLGCLTSPTDLSGLFDKVTIANSMLRFMVDNNRLMLGTWQCESSCFTNNAQPDLTENMGELTIKPETVRFVVCATRDLVEDAGFNFENWLFQKIAEGMRATINSALVLGDGIGMPFGIMRAGIPICEASASTPPGTFSWQDLVMLLYQLPMEMHANATWVMNQTTFALLLSMSDGIGRPLLNPLPQGTPAFTLVGRPVVIATQMPDCSPGSTPIAVGDWKRAFTIVTRKAPTISVDPFTAGFCLLYAAEARVGSGATCPNACRLLRIR